MSDETPKGPEQLSRRGWAAIIAAIALVACLVGFVGGSILISAGVSAYSGWAGISVTQVAVTAVTVSGPTYTPYATYTPLPTYTPQATYTLAPTALSPTDTPLVVITPTSAPPGVGMLYVVQEGDTVQSVADRFAVDVVLVIYANGLDPANPGLQVGSQIRLPTRAADLCIPDNSPVQATVIDVIDGDTINVLVDGQPLAVRYIGVDAPTMDPVAEPFGPEALNANQEMVNDRTVALVEDITQADALEQLPRYVLVGDMLVNYELVRQGWVIAISTPPDSACDELFALAAGQARSEALGLWAEQTPGGQPTGTATLTLIQTASPTAPPVVWVPPATIMPTSTSSLGFKCNCSGKHVWGDFYSQTQADLCQAICEIAAQR